MPTPKEAAASLPSRTGRQPTVLKEGARQEQEEQWDLIVTMDNFAMRLGTALFFCTAIGFMTWMWRAAANLETLAGRQDNGLTRKCVWAWLVPGLNLYLPFAVMQEIWKGSDPDGGGRASGMVRAWWLTLLIYQVVQKGNDLIFNGIAKPAVKEVLTYHSARMIADGLGIIGATLALLVVWKITSRQELRAKSLPEDE